MSNTKDEVDQFLRDVGFFELPDQTFDMDAAFRIIDLVNNLESDNLELQSQVNMADLVINRYRSLLSDINDLITVNTDNSWNHIKKLLEGLDFLNGDIK